MHISNPVLSDIYKLLSAKKLRYIFYILLSFILISIFFSSCSDNKFLLSRQTDQENVSASIKPQNSDDINFEIKTRYSYIKSYPSGGGTFIIKLIPYDTFTGNVNLSINANDVLNARIDRNVLNESRQVAEIIIRPEPYIEIRTYDIEVKATQLNYSHSILIEVEIINWGQGNISSALAKRNVFVEWLEDKYPEFNNLSGSGWYAYATYPGLLVVEHWTFLYSDWEMRICFHVMIPPYDWSKILIRRRGEWDPEFAAIRNSNGSIFKMPVSEYPIMFLY